ncbi:MAG TPA: glycosyltransferase [Flavobacterium sp.]|nr:glycosyltransferase [Flavobacterium sp.]
MEEKRKPQASIIVCCYNSTKRIIRTLEHIDQQKVRPGVCWELIVVDNNSSDNTTQVVTDFLSDSSGIPSYKVVHEPNPGLSSARRKGVAESSAEIIIYCDDDNWLDQNYVQNVLNIMNGDESIGMLGGIGEAVTDSAAPEWFEANKASYAVGPQYEEEADITHQGGYVYGAGAALRKTPLLILDAIGFQHALSDRIGNKMVSGGDNELGYALVLLNYKIYYSPKLAFKHYIPSNRLTKEHLSKFQVGQTYTFRAVRTYRNYMLNNHLLYEQPLFKKALQRVISSFKTFLKYLAGRSTYFDLYLHYKKTISIVNYYYFWQKKDREIYLQVVNNINAINNYKLNQNNPVAIASGAQGQKT